MTNDTILCEAHPAAPLPMSFFQALPLPELIERFRTGSHRLDPRLLHLTDEQLDRTFDRAAGAGAWSCRVLIGHLADADLVYAHRMRRTIGEDRPMLALFDEHAFIDAGLYAPALAGSPPPVASAEAGIAPAGFVAVIHTLRLWGGQWLASLTEAQFERIALHPEQGEFPIRRQLEYVTYHLEHHGWFLTAKLNDILGPAKRDTIPPSGCGTGCKCVTEGSEE